MIIRCERCSTVYELEDAVLSPEGSEVQCARCQHVFTARPPQAPGRTLPGMPPPPEAAESPAPTPRPTPRATPAPVSSPTPPPGSAASFTPAPQSRRPSVYRPPVSQPAVPRAQVLRRDAVGTFEKRLRWNHRWKWLAPSMLALAVVLAIVWKVAPRLLPLDAGGERVRERALALALADDVKSLEQARDDLGRLSGIRIPAARADRAMVELLLAGALSAPEAHGARKEESAALVRSAETTLGELARANLAAPEVARARAVGAALSAERVELRRLATVARGALPNDPQADLAEHGADVRSTDRTVRDRAVADLVRLLARRPDLLRGRYLLAQGQALAGHRDEALATLNELLRRNPRHERAMALQEAITHPPATAAIASPPGAPGGSAGSMPSGATTAAPAREEKPAALPRKPDSTARQTGPAPSESPAAGAPATAKPEPAGAGPAPADAPADGEPAPVPRLRPAAVPEPEVVEGGG